MEIETPKALRGLYEPRPNTKVYYGGRGGAKSTACANALLVQGMAKPLRILCAREVQKSIKLSVYSLLCDKIQQYGLTNFYTIKSDTIEGKNGTSFFFVGLQGHTVDSLKSIEKINRCWVEEAHNVTDKSWEILLPSLFRVDDCQLWVTFNTRKITDPTYIRFVLNADSDSLVKKVSWRDNPWFPEGLNKQRLKLQETDPEAYLHVWEGEPDTRHNGSVYAKYIDKAHAAGRVVAGIYDPSRPVNTAWDLGWSDSTAIIFFQIVGTEIRIIDYYESFNEDVPHYCQLILSKKYNYNKHFAPHDAGNKLLAAGGRSIAEIANQNGVRMTIIPETTHAQRIEAARSIMPSVWFDADNTKDLINALMNYSYKYSEDLKRFSDTPVHDWSSHGSTAFELLARVAHDETIKKPLESKTDFMYKGDQSGNIVGTINIKEYLRRKAKERND